MKINKLKPYNLSLVKKVAKDIYPITTDTFDFKVSENIFSPYYIELPKAYKIKIEDFYKTLNKIYNHNFSQLKQNNIKLKSENFNDVDFKDIENNPNILSCLDFHINLETQELALIEANTNASGYLVGSLVYALHDIDFKIWQNKLFQMFSENLNWETSKLLVTDENPSGQKMYLEFLLYQEFCKQHGKNIEIIDSQELDSKIDSMKKEFEYIGIYNRSTDFYLKDHPKLLKSYLNQEIKLNPNPIGYDLFAHKDNLTAWSEIASDETLCSKLKIDSVEAKHFKKLLLPSKPMKEMFKDLDEAWSQRKKYFFKPSNSFGGKATYRGASISKKYFESAWNDNFLAQSYFPPPKFKDSDNLEWKFDLRVYVYKDEVLFSLARIYTGQITNFSSPGGGFAPVTYY